MVRDFPIKHRNASPPRPTFARIYRLVAMIPSGRVTSYGRLARLAEVATPRVVGFALAALPEGTPIPWHRVIKADGTMAPRPGVAEQRQRLAAEGVIADTIGQIDWHHFSWEGPSAYQQALLEEPDSAIDAEM